MASVIKQVKVNNTTYDFHDIRIDTNGVDTEVIKIEIQNTNNLVITKSGTNLKTTLTFS